MSGRTKVISALMMCHNEGMQLSNIYQWLKGFSAQPVTSSFTLHFYSSFFPFGSHLLLRQKQLGAVRANKESFYKGLQNYLLLRAPVTSRQSMSLVSGWSFGSEADILIQSAANNNNALPLLKLTHLTSVIQLRAKLHWPSCCDFMCLHGRKVFTVEIAAPSFCPFNYRRKRSDLIYLSSLEESYNYSL